MTVQNFDPRAYWDRRLDRHWSLHGVGVVTLSHSYNRWLYRVRDRVLRRVVADLPVDLRGGRVLDIGPGVGFYVERWKQRGAKVTAVDIADSAVRRLRARHPDVRVERLDVSDDVSFLGTGYDVVSAFDVFFHIVDDERYRAAMRNVASMLRPGGYFVISDTFAKVRTGNGRHYVRRSSAEIEDAILAAGMEITRRRPGFVLMTYPYDASARARRVWSRLIGETATSEMVGNLLGAALFLPEIALTRILRDGPCTEVVICRRPVDGEQDERPAP